MGLGGNPSGSPPVTAGAKPAEERVTAYAWYVLVVLILGYVASLIDRQILSLMVAPVRQDLGLTDTQLSLLHGLAFALFYTGFGIPLGWLADHWRRRELLILGIAGWALATAACGLATSFGQLFLARMAVGMGEAALAPAAYSLIHDYFPARRRALAIALFGTGALLGSGLAFIVGGNAVAYGAVGTAWMAATFDLTLRPWQFVFVAVSLPAFAVMLLFITIREPARTRPPAREGQRGGGILDGVVAVWANRHWFGPPIMAVSLAAIAQYGLHAWVPSHFIRVFGWRPEQIGTAYGTILLTAGMAGMWLGGLISDRLYQRNGLSGIAGVMMWGNLIAGAATMTFGFMPDPIVALAILAIAAFAYGTATAVGPVIIQGIAPDHIRGQSIAITFFMLSIFGLGLGPTLIAACSDYVLDDELHIGRAVGVVAMVVMPIVVWLAATTRRRLRSFSGPA